MTEHPRTLSPTRRLTVATLTAIALSGTSTALTAPQHALAATTGTVTPIADGNFEQTPPQTAWTERQSSGAELVDGYYPHTGSLSADLCDIDSCNDGHGNAGDTLTQAFTSPGQVVSAQLTYWYSVATSEPNHNSACHDWLSVGLGLGTTPDPSASTRYCASTGTQYLSATLDVTAFLNAHGGQQVTAQVEGYTDGINPSEFFVDDMSLTITYLLTPSAPAVATISDCGAGQTTLTWAPPQFPLGNAWPVQSYLVTPYSVSGVAQPGVTVPGTQTSLQVSLGGGTICYFTVTATNANGTGPAGAPAVPVAAVTALSPPQSTGYPLSWSLQPGSAAVAWYTVWSRDGSGPWLQWGSTTATSTMLFGAAGHSYEYYVEAMNSQSQGVAPSGAGQTSATVPTSATPAMAMKAVYGVDAYGVLHPADSPPLATASGWSWQIARGIVTNSSGAGGYVLDGWGGISAFGNAPAVAGGAYWPGWDIARGIALRPGGTSGYVVDGFGGLHPFGGAPALTGSAYWSWDIARGIALEPSGLGGYVLDGFGGLHPFGDARPVTVTAYWPGWDIARGVALRADGASGYVLDAFGGLHPFGGAPPLSGRGYWPGWDVARGLVLTASGQGGYVADALGGFHGFGNVNADLFSPNWQPNNLIVRGASGS